MQASTRSDRCLMDGLLVIDKPVGPTSHDVVARVRRMLGEQRVGHTGTLDPGASGVLPLVVGRATRLARFLSAAEKSYEAAIRLGVATDTGRRAGTAGRATVFKGRFPDASAIDRALDAFRGTFLQQPPAYSAKKIGGKRSHRLARAQRARGRLTCRPASPALPPRPPSAPCHGSRAGARQRRGDRVTLRVDCSAGFYVRSLAHDLGERLGIGAHLARLRRTAERRPDARRRRAPRRRSSAIRTGGRGRARPAGAHAAGAHRADADRRGRPAGGARARPRARRFRRRVSSDRAAAGATRDRSVCSTARASSVGDRRADRATSGLLHPSVVLV